MLGRWNPRFFTIFLLVAWIAFPDYPASAQIREDPDYGLLVARFPYVASRAGWCTRVDVLCVDPSQGHEFTFVGKGETGETVEVLENQAIRSMGSFSAYIYLQGFISLFSKEVKEEIYSIDVFSKTALPGHVVTYVQYTDTRGSLQSSMRIDGLGLYHRLPIEWIVTGISGWFTGVNLQNYSDRVIDVYFRKQDGEFLKPAGSKFDLSQPNSSRAFLFAELLSGSPIGSGEFLAFASGSELAESGLQVNGEPVDALSGLTVFANTGEHGMSEGIPAVGAFADGSHQFGSRFYLPMRSIEEIHDDPIRDIIEAKYPYYGFALQNTNDFPITARLTHFRPDGNDLGGTVLNLAAGANVGYTWNGLRQYLGVTDETLIFKPEIGGHVRIELFDGEENTAFGTAMTADGEGQFAIVTGEKALNERDEGFRLAGFYVENWSQSSLIQLVNTTGEATDVEIKFYDSGGSTRAESEVAIPGHGQFSLNIQDLPEWPQGSGWNGILLVESSDSPIVGIQHDYSRGKEISYTKVSGKRLTPFSGGGALYATDPIVGNLRFAPAGTFVQGSPPTLACRGIDETQFTHTLTQNLAVMETEVTQQMWGDLRAVQPSLPEDPSRFNGPGNPVEDMTWYEAVLFANLLSLENGFTRCYYVDADLTQPVTSGNFETDGIYVKWDADGYRLPTEGEWEYFARAGTKGPFSIVEPSYTPGNCDSCSPSEMTNLQSVAWYCVNSGKKTHPVGEKMANPWGLKDLHGNVGEFCWDVKGIYPVGSLTDYRGAPSGTHRVVRGGSYISDPRFLRSAIRGSRPADLGSFYFGFRLLRSVN